MKMEEEEKKLVEKIINGEVQIHEVDSLVRNVETAVRLRREALERLCKTTLKNIGKFSIDAKRAMKANIENMIGIAQIPIGVAGPIKVEGDYAKSLFHLPLATTEGALVASVNRGCTAINKSGGAVSFVIRDGIARAPVLRAKNTAHAREALNFVIRNEEEIKEMAEATDPFLQIERIEPYIVGRNLFFRFICNTGDAMGMNMATIATDKAISFIEKETGLQHIALSGNMCVDKKPSALNFMLGRGKTVISEAVLDRNIVEKVLKTSPEAMTEVCYRKCWIGSALAASYGFNAHFANIVAAIFIATGQDAAHVVEASMGFTTAELTEEGNLLVEVTMPSLQIGTIGGGTALGTQRECLEMMGVYGAGEPPGSNANKFAEIIAAAVLAGEISLIGALAARHLAEAHIRLNR